ncbi:MAG: amidohydrolase family protein [Clostridia bacterium]|nr:amidohydrolase family protein [Clostridia bacterium]
MRTHRILIRNGRIWDGERFFEGSVAVKDGKIAALGDTADFECSYTYDADGDIICAGLVDIHTHLRYLSEQFYEVDGEPMCFSCGVTAAADGGTVFASAALEYSALKTRVFIPVSIRDGEPDFSLADRLVPYYGQRAVGLKVYFDKGVSGDCGAAPLKAICERARKMGLKVMVHCTNPPTSMMEMLSCMSEGDICTHAYHGRGHTAAEDGFECLRYAKEKGIILDLGLAQGYHADINILSEAVSLGLAPDTISTDLTCDVRIGACSYGMRQAMDLLRAVGMDEESVLRAVTSNAAAAVDMEDGVGHLTVGGNADIAVLRYGSTEGRVTDKNKNTLDIKEGYTCMLTVSDGVVVYRSDRK